MRRTATALAGACAAAALLVLAACTSTSGTSPSGSPSASAAEQDSSRPNFVFVLTDDLSWNLVSHMPHVQALRKSGTTLSKYYVVDSLCCPSRSAIFTGEYPHDDGVFTNTGSDGGYGSFQSHGDQNKTFAVALHQHGYQTAMMGKYLNGYHTNDPVPPGWDTWDVAGQGGYSEFNYTLNENGKAHHYGRQASDYLTDVVSSKAGDFIQSASKPFMLEVATFAPHAPYTPAPRYANAAANLQYPRTPAYDKLPTGAPSWLADDPALTARDNTMINQVYRKRVEADMATDDMIGHLESELKAKGIADNTYIVFSSDNGYHMGDYRLLPGKQTAFDTDVHVPLIVAGPHVPAGQTSDQLASNIDLAPTFESLSGSKVNSSVDGTSLSGLWHGQHPTNWQQAVLVEHHHTSSKQKSDPDAQNDAHADPPTYEALRTANALYVRYTNGQQEYYNTATDPYELHNLASQGVPVALPRMMAAMQQCHGAQACQSAAGA